MSRSPHLGVRDLTDLLRRASVRQYTSSSRMGTRDDREVLGDPVAYPYSSYSSSNSSTHLMGGTLVASALPLALNLVRLGLCSICPYSSSRAAYCRPTPRSELEQVSSVLVDVVYKVCFVVFSAVRVSILDSRQLHPGRFSKRKLHKLVHPCRETRIHTDPPARTLAHAICTRGGYVSYRTN